MEEYTAKSLKILKGLEPVRTRPGMYIGSTDIKGLHHLVWEILDNAIDEANNSYGKNIYVTLNADDSITIEDEGRGVPYEYNATEKMLGFDIVYTTLHGGGKFDDTNYKTSSGLHGVGGAVVNALSEFMEIHSYKDGYDNFIRYENGGRKSSGLKRGEKTYKRGTKVIFKPNFSIFSNNKFDYSLIKQHMNDSAALCKGVTFYLKDETTNRKDTFLYKDGLIEYFKKVNAMTQFMGSIVSCSGVSENGISVEVFYAFSQTNYDEKIISFANGVKTVDEGHHVAGFKKSITTLYNNYALNHKLIKENNKLEGEDIREGMRAIVSVRIPENLIEFVGQTKEKLGTKEASSAVSSIMENSLRHFLEEHSKETDMVIKKTIEAMNLRRKEKEFKEKERSKKDGPSITLSGKLSPCSSKEYSKNELFIVEGDSAGGSAKKARDPKHQAILPLRGKPKNVAEVTNPNEIFENQELSTLIATIGAGSDSTFNIKNIHYDKVIIMTDADDDGAHIQNLLLSFFYQHLRPLVEQGHVYIAVSPLYRVYKGNKEIYCWSEKEREDACKSIPGYKITRYKGLGEMDAKQLKETTMQKETRKLIQILCTDEEECKDKVNLFLGKDSDRRKDWIANNIDFTVRDIHFKELEDVNQE